MLTKSHIATIKSLSKKSNRDDLSLFVVEGEKMAVEVATSHFVIKECYATSDLSDRAVSLLSARCDIVTINSSVMGRISSLKSPSSVLLVVEQPCRDFDIESLVDGDLIMLDGVQDPGNMGTIIRLADWFGIKNIVCSYESADQYNSKVVQSTMGSILRVNIYYGNLPAIIAECRERGMDVYGTFLGGDNIYESTISAPSVMVFGSEGRGISPEVEAMVSHKITIPCFGEGASDSLNVAVAAAICCSEFRRKSKV